MITLQTTYMYVLQDETLKLVILNLSFSTNFSHLSLLT